MNAPAKMAPPTLAKLREPFPANCISKLPKESRAQIEERKQRKNTISNCPVCGGYHHKNAVHLDYVGHAALTDRLLDTDPEWTWEPVAFGPDGLPQLDRNGGLWIRLTVLGVTRLGYGDAEGKQGGNAIKEAIGDALRNAAMRFGAALDLWHKGDLHAVDADEPDAKPEPKRVQSEAGGNAVSGGMSDASFMKITGLLQATGTLPSVVLEHFKVKAIRDLNRKQFEEAVDKLESDLARMAKEKTNKAQSAESFGEILDDDIPF